MAKEFTAQEMRDKAFGLEESDRPHWFGVGQWSEISDMLRFAADVVERCDKAIAILSKVRSAMSFDCEVGSCGAYCIDPDVSADNALDNAIDLLRGCEVKEER